MNRIIDPGAIFGGWVGLGTSLVVVMAFELIIPVQPAVFLLAPVAGILIGVYANVRSERWRPRGRVLANATYAAFVSGVGLALLYVVIRLVFIYGDTGALPDGTSLGCQTGPDCVYQRLLIQERDSDRSGELAAEGITDAASLEAAAWRELAITGTALVILTVGGGVIGGFIRSFSRPPTSLPLPHLEQGAAD